MTSTASTIAVLKDAWRVFASQGGRLLAGAIAYSAVLSLVPLLLLTVQVAAVFMGEGTAHATLLANLTRWVGVDGAQTIGDLLTRARHGGAHETVIGAAVLVWGSTRLFGALRRSLDALWDVAPPLEDTMRNKAQRFVEYRLRGFAFVIVCGFVLVALAFGHAALAMVRRFWDLSLFGTVGEIVLSFLLTAAMFAGMFRLLPTKAVPIHDATVGGLITSALFTAGALLAGQYVAHQAASSPFGAATSVVLLLVWVHYSAHTFLFGAAITAARAKRKGLL
ncbi:MAG: YihY/virulence factor BrkB family protein [Polyangiaceae bacterium]|nr:YihY/virulence factor BrkB family protein [Polyangiaceae bacterium]